LQMRKPERLNILGFRMEGAAVVVIVGRVDVACAYLAGNRTSTVAMMMLMKLSL